MKEGIGSYENFEDYGDCVGMSCVGGGGGVGGFEDRAGCVVFLGV